jgi:hypothetical protein
MSKKDPNIDFQTISFSLANGETRDIFGPYNYFRIMELNGADELTVKFQEGTKQLIPVSVGIGFPFSDEGDLSQITLTNDSGSSVTGKISIAAGGEISDSRATIGGTVKTKEVSDTIQTGTETGTWSITPQAGCKALTVRAGASDITVGNDGAALNFTIGAGESYTFKTTDTIHGSGVCSWIEEYDA